MIEFNTFDALVDSVKSEGDIFWQEQAKLNFAKDISALMSINEITKADLARKLDVSQARITQCLRGDKNLQIETMISLARAVGGELHLKVHDRTHRPHFFASIDGGVKKPDYKNCLGQHRIYVRNPDGKAPAVA